MKLSNKPLHNPFHFLRTRKSLMSSFSILMTIAILHLTVSCSYYKVRPVNTKPETMADHIRTFNEQNKYVVLHSGDNYWHLENITISENDLSLSGVIKAVEPGHQVESHSSKKTSFKYKKNKTQPLN